jgi:hypothetical protein
MSTLIAACGLDCGSCEAYLATQANDPAAKERLLAKWRVEYNSPDIPLAALTCDGCLTPGGRAGGYCVQCGIRRCVQKRQLANCSACIDYPCPILTGFWKAAPQARANLEALRPVRLRGAQSRASAVGTRIK